jgi:hypothetical protein
VFHQPAYQLIVTRRGAGPDSLGYPPNEWELRNPGFNGQKRSQKRATAIDVGCAEIWLGQRLVNGVNLSRISSF